MKVDISFDGSNLLNRFSSATLDRVEYNLVNQVMQDMDQFVPKRQGYLRGSVTPLGHTLTYNKPYARAQFYGVVNGHPITRYTTPGTGPRWDLKAKGVYMKDWKNVVVKGLDKHGSS